MRDSQTFRSLLRRYSDGGIIPAADTSAQADSAQAPAEPEKLDTSSTGGTGKTFSQADVDALIKARLDREKKSMPTKEELKAFREYQDSQKTADQLSAEKIAAAEAARISTEQKAAQLEAKVTAFSKGVKPEAVDDVIALAMAKVTDDTDISEAIDAVVKKYPSFCGKTVDKGITTGVNFGSAENNETDGVTAAFLARNPGLKI